METPKPKSKKKKHQTPCIDTVFSDPPAQQQKTRGVRFSGPIFFFFQPAHLPLQELPKRFLLRQRRARPHVLLRFFAGHLHRVRRRRAARALAVTVGGWEVGDIEAAHGALGEDDQPISRRSA